MLYVTYKAHISIKLSFSRFMTPDKMRIFECYLRCLHLSLFLYQKGCHLFGNRTQVPKNIIGQLVIF